ncbi:hypothetical protein OG21DRAFT_268390 [Imleria badia]|nr:hypothetical protein OG21DRAFT_268390 [Imleria badia]
MADSEFQSLVDPLEMPNPSYPSYPNPLLDESTAHNPVFPSSFATEGFQYISSPDPPYLYHAGGTTLANPTPPTLPHSSPPLYPPSLAEPPNITPGAMSAFDQAQDQTPPSTSTTSDGFWGSAATHAAPPFPPATANLATDPSNTVYTCQCVTDGSLCNAAVGGSARAVRDHLRVDHALRCVGKDRVVCPWAGCSRTLQRESIPRHILSCHFRAGVLCVECGLTLSRSDVRYSHARVCRRRRQTASQLDSNVSSANAG